MLAIVILLNLAEIDCVLEIEARQELELPMGNAIFDEEVEFQLIIDVGSENLIEKDDGRYYERYTILFAGPQCRKSHWCAFSYWSIFHLMLLLFDIYLLILIELIVEADLYHKQSGQSEILGEELLLLDIANELLLNRRTVNGRIDYFERSLDVILSYSFG